MWGLERLWLEGLLWGAGITLSLWERGRAYIIPLLLSVYGAGLLYEVGTASVLIETSWWAGRLGLIFSLLTTASWIAYPPSREGALALLIQLGAYTLLLRSAHLTMTWALLETGAIAGYFVALTLSRKENPWGTALTYFTWNVVGSALILMAIALRLAEGKGLSYPLASAGWLSDGLLGWGWAIKVGFLPWQGWLLRLYEALPPVWAGWFSAVPKGALLSSLLFMLPDTGEGGLQLGVFYLLSAGTLIGAYNIAWRQASVLRILFWGSLGQGAFLSLVLVPGAQVAGWYFWMVYAVGTWVSFVYAERPWLSSWGRAVGLLLLANLAALPPVLGFWVKVALFERGFQLLTGPWRAILLGSGAFALIGGLLSYGKALYILWESPPLVSMPSRPYQALYLLAALAFLLLGIGVGLL
jgi:NADH:ubiquinone oxidoreductase subunit 2 (subunit N)